MVLDRSYHEFGKKEGDPRSGCSTEVGKFVSCLAVMHFHSLLVENEQLS